MQVANGATDVTTYFVLRDATTHAPKTDVTITDIDLYYVEQGAAISAKADATALAAADSAHGDNQAFHVGQGLYRVDWPDAAFDGGVGKVVNLIVVCTGVDTTFLEVELTGVPQTGDAYARLGAPAGASVSADIAAVKTQTGAIETDTQDLQTQIGTDGAGLTALGDARLANLDATVSSRSTLDAAGVWSHATRTLSSFGTLVADIWANVTRTLTAQADSAGVTTLLSRVVGTLAAGTHQPQTGDAYARLGAPAGASVSADIANVPTVAEFEARTLPAADYTVVSDLPSVPSAGENATAAAAAILATPANKLATDAIGRVTPDAVTPATDVSALALEATVQAILTDTGTDGVVVADKTGYQLAADGLDAITATEPTGKPTTFAGWVMWLVQRFRRADMTTTTLTVKTEAGATVTQQTVSDDGTTQSIGAPS